MAACEELDETMCRNPICQHPQCWRSYRRIERGYHRYRSVGSIRGASSEGGLPSLKITNLPDPHPPLMGLDGHYFRVSSSLGRPGTLSPAVTYDPWNKTSKGSLDRIYFPGVNSFVESQTSRRKCPQHSSPTRLQKVEVIDMSLTSALFHDVDSRPAPLVWVPSAQWKCQQHKQEKHHREESFKVGIKELTLQSFNGADVRSEEADALKSRKNKKVPTGGNPSNLEVSYRGGPRSLKTAASFIKDQTEELHKGKRRFCGTNRDRSNLKSQAPRVPLPENRRVVLHSTKERRQSVLAVPSTGPVYKLDYKNFPDEMEIDLNSIRNQPYLWKKYIDVAGPGGTVRASDHQRSQKKQPRVFLGDFGLFPNDSYSTHSYYKQDPSGGSVTSNPGHSDSPSLGSLSQGSWTDSPVQSTGREPIEAPDEEDPGERSEEIKILEPDEDQRPSPTDPPLTPTGEGTYREQMEEESKMADPPESTPAGTELSAQSPQPAPPPPSPMHTDN
ncbi:uncharacterized protein C9orf43 homolog [Discoglossus pictus]